MNNKRKGNQGQSDFANFMQAHGFRCQSDGSRSGGGEWKGDIHNELGMSIEVKTCKKINLNECWKQTDRDAQTSRTMPVLAIHFDHMPQGSWLMVTHSEDWVESLKNNRGEQVQITGVSDSQRALKWALEQLKVAITKVLKLIE